MGQDTLKVAGIVIQANPDLITSEETVSNLVAGDHIDMCTGMKMQDMIKARDTSEESVEESLLENQKVIKFPSEIQQKNINTILALATSEEAESLTNAISTINSEFEKLAKKHKADIEKVITGIKTIEGVNLSVVEKMEKEVKKEIFIVK